MTVKAGQNERHDMPRMALVAIALVAVLSTVIAIQPEAQAQGGAEVGLHAWRFNNSWTTRGGDNYIDRYFDNQQTNTLGARHVPSRGGTASLFPKYEAGSVVGYGAQFPGPLTADCADAVPDMDYECAQANFEVDDAADVLNPGTNDFVMQAIVRLGEQDLPVQTQTKNNGSGLPGLNIFQRGAFGDSGGQYKLSIDGGTPECRWSDGNVNADPDANAALLELDGLNLATGANQNAWYRIICKKEAVGDNQKLTITVRRLIHNGTAYINDPAFAAVSDQVILAGDDVLGAIAPTAAVVSIGGLGNSTGVNDHFTGDLDRVVLKILG